MFELDVQPILGDQSHTGLPGEAACQLMPEEVGAEPSRAEPSRSSPSRLSGSKNVPNHSNVVRKNHKMALK